MTMGKRGRVVTRALALLMLVAAAQAGTLSGSVTFKGTPRAPRAVQMDADPTCSMGHTEPSMDEKFVVGTPRGDVYPVADVFVYVKSGLPARAYPPPAGPALINQVGCHYMPHVLGVRVGQPVQFKNSDETFHNVHSLSTSSPFNLIMPSGSPNTEGVFTQPEVMAKLKCDAHPWMGCYVGVLPHPFFAVTTASGQFAIEGLDDGEYEVEVWQEIKGTRSARVTVANGQGTIDFQYTGD